MDSPEDEGTGELTHVGPLPPIPGEMEEAWSRVNKRGFKLRMRRALYLVALGASPAAAARALGYHARQEVWRNARETGLYRPGSEQLIGQSRRIAHMAGEELERRVLEDAQAMKTHDLVVTRGVEIDKTSRYEKWGKKEEDAPGSFVSALSEIAARIDAGEVELKIKVRKTAPIEDALDVTPR